MSKGNPDQTNRSKNSIGTKGTRYAAALNTAGQKDNSSMSMTVSKISGRQGIIIGFRRDKRIMSEQEKRLIIFLVENDDDTRPVLRENLQTEGYRVLLALDEEDALERVSDGGARADLVLVNLVGKSPKDAVKVGRRIREHAKYDGHTPLVVMAEKYGEDLEGTDVNVSGNDWITYLEDHEQLKNLLARLLSKPTN